MLMWLRPPGNGGGYDGVAGAVAAVQQTRFSEVVLLTTSQVEQTDSASLGGMLDAWLGQNPVEHVVAVAVIAIVAHVIVIVVRRAFYAWMHSKLSRPTKVRTLSHFASSVVIFLIYFGAAGLILKEVGVSLSAYIASATVIGFAVSFGSQGLIQDVITSMTLITTDLLDVGDMVDIGGQVGIVERVGMRFTVLVNFAGAEVNIPNRNVANVINYDLGYIRVFADVRLPEEAERRETAIAKLRVVAESAFEQFRGAMLLRPIIHRERQTGQGARFVRIEFRIWPGQGGLIEGPVKQAMIIEIKSMDEAFSDWMVAVHYRAQGERGDVPLPVPEAVRRVEPEASGAD